MPKTLDVTTTALPSVKRALAAVGATVSAVHPTPGAVGYTTITVHRHDQTLLARTANPFTRARHATERATEVTP